MESSIAQEGLLSLSSKSSGVKGTSGSGPLDAGSSLDAVVSGIDTEIANLHDQISDLERQIEVRRHHIETLGVAREVVLRRRSPSAVSNGSVTVEPQPVKAVHRQRRSGSQVETIVRHAKQILLREGRPLSRTELLAFIEAEGYAVKASNPAKRVGKILWSQEEFEHIGNGYWVKGEPIPASGES